MSTPPKGDPARGWQALEAMIARDEDEWLETATDEEIEQRMAADGVKMPEVPSADEFLARVKKRAASRGSAPVVPLPERRTPRAVWIAGLAIAAGIGLAVGLASRDSDHVAHGRPPLTQEERARAASLRESAFVACDAKNWVLCAGRLDEAGAIDPAGDEDPRVVAARKAIAEGQGPR
ncbi:MAG TPA: hypothetical protein VKU41_25415 [Polyangiaceae bacterium]|nr:hypothetical protein [Polyangiaceae bacterium]